MSSPALSCDYIVPRPTRYERKHPAVRRCGRKPVTVRFTYYGAKGVAQIRHYCDQHKGGEPAPLMLSSSVETTPV